MALRYLSLFSGIEAATVAWRPLGWECVAVAEIEPFSCAVLTHHYPNVPNLGDVTKITEADIAALGEIDVVVFGSPCQDLSVAGHRKGLIDANGNVTRSGLFFTAVNIARWSKARYWLWENVPGAFSSNAGRDFAAVVGFMAGLDEVPVPIKRWGYEGCALGSNGLLEWGVLDAQWFGVAQRRRRVFALLDTGDWRSRPPILLEPEGLRGDSAPSRKARESIAPGAGASVTSDGEKCRELTKTTLHAPEVARCIATREGSSQDYETTTMVVHGTQDPCTSSTTAFALGRNNGGAEGFGAAGAEGLQGAGLHREIPRDGVLQQACAASEAGYSGCSATEQERGGQSRLGQTPFEVRRLTCEEVEFLQGFPRGYTAIPWRGKPADQCPDGPRYKALGNSMAVPVMRWIGGQIEIAELF